MSVNPTVSGEARRNNSLRSYILSHPSQVSTLSWGRNSVTVSGLEQFPGMGPGRVRITKSRQHPRELGNPVVALQAPHPAGAASSVAIDHEVHVGVRRDLWQVRHHDDLPAAGQ